LNILATDKPGNANCRRKLIGTVDFLLKVACFVKKYMFAISKAADLN